MGTVVAVLEIIQPVLKDVAVWRFDHLVWQGVPIVDDAVCEEVCSLLSVRYYWFMQVASFILSRSSSCVGDNPVNMVDTLGDVFFIYIEKPYGMSTFYSNSQRYASNYQLIIFV